MFTVACIIREFCARKGPLTFISASDYNLVLDELNRKLHHVILTGNYPSVQPLYFCLVVQYLNVSESHYIRYYFFFQKFSEKL